MSDPPAFRPRHARSPRGVPVDPIDVDWRRPWLAARTEHDPDGLALVVGDRETSFAELDAHASALARGLRRRGLEPGGRVALLVGASERFVALVHACQYAGLVVAPLNARLTPAELDVQIRRLEPALLVHDAANVKLAHAASGSLDGGRILDAAVVADGPGAGRGAIERLDVDAVATVVFTSGTAGAPKGVVLPTTAHLASARGVLANLGVTRNDRWLVPLPLYHVGGLAVLYRSALAGFAVVLDDPAVLLSSADRAGVCLPTIASLVPTMLARLLDRPAGSARSAVQPPTVVLGGGPCARDLRERAAAAGIAVVTSYGLTETASQITATAPGDDPVRTASAGRPLRGVEIRIAGPDTEGYGEILVRAPQVMLGYLEDVAATQRALRDGWLHTGDIGRLGVDGTLDVATRRDDLIVSGGENVVPEEVEAVLLSHPSVREAAVFGRDDEEWGQRVAATVVPATAAGVDTAELERWCRQRLAGYKIPRSFEIASSLPRTASGKIMRRALAAADTGGPAGSFSC